MLLRIEFIPILIFIVIFAFFFTYFILFKLKGKLEIRLLKKKFYDSDKISGQLSFKAKKEIDANSLKIFLKRQEYISYGKSGKWADMFSEEQLLEPKRKIRRGFRNTYSFSFKIPNNNLDNKNFYSFEGFSFGKKQIRWLLDARLDAKGIDLYTTKKIQVVQNPHDERTQEFPSSNSSARPSKFNPFSK